MKQNGGFTLIELLIVVTVIGIIAALSVPGLVRARITGNEASAVGSLRAINSAQASYAAGAANGGYAVLLATLALPCPGGAMGFISPDLAFDPTQKSGYVITLGAGAAGPGPNDCNGTASWDGYYLTAVPITVGMTGHRGFATAPAGTIFFDSAGVAPTEAQMAPGGGGTPIQ